MTRGAGMAGGALSGWVVVLLTQFQNEADNWRKGRTGRLHKTHGLHGSEGPRPDGL